MVGDVGPNNKVGEASLRIAKQINALSTPYNRPVSDLKVTYVVFPATADKTVGPPDLEKLQAHCEALVKEIGGASVPLHHWENIIAPSPTPSPTPAPSPSASATTSSSPGASVSTSASPSPTFAFRVVSPAATTPPNSTLTPTISPAGTRRPVKKHKP
ncbi:MAG: hypothetical protein DMF00_08175 [Verrucomicrobia bacterium]|nr:MAG: hypothetical protein DMF00_08175 [Verrucomicrobiota bacterium]